MNLNDLTWRRISYLPVKERCEVLAILLSPYVDRKTGVLHDTPNNILIDLFRGQMQSSSVQNLVALLKQHGFLEYATIPDRQRKGWFLRLTKELACSNETRAVYFASLRVAAQEFVKRFGKQAIPAYIAILREVR